MLKLKTGLPMLSRKKFIKQIMAVSGAMVAGPGLLEAAELLRPVRLTILHTNDTHSQMDPFPMNGGRNQGLGELPAGHN